MAGLPTTLGPPIPGSVDADDEDRKSAFQHEVTDPAVPQIEEFRQIEILREDDYYAVAEPWVPPPKAVAPPPKVRPPHWLAPPPPPQKVDDYDESEYDYYGQVEGEEQAESLVYKSKLEEYLSIEAGMQKNCRSLPVTLALWLSFTILVFFHGQAETSYAAAMFNERAVLDIEVPASEDPRTGHRLRRLQIGNILSLGDILRWTEEGLVKMLSVDEQSHGQIQEGAQALVGFLRMTQTRGVASEDCTDMSSDLSKYYDAICHPPGGSPERYGGANVTSMDDSFRPDSNGKFVAYAELGRASATIKERFQILRDGGWLDLNTQEVELDALLFAPLSNVYSHLTVVFKLHREGLMQQEVKVQPLRGDIYSHWTHTFFDIVWAFSLIALLVYMAIEVYNAASLGKRWLRMHIRDPFTWLDVVCFFGGCGIGIFFWVLLIELDQLMEEVVTIGGTLPTYAVTDAPQRQYIEMVKANREYQAHMSDLLDHFKWLVMQTTRHRLCAFWYSMALGVRFFRGFQGQPRIAVMIRSINFATDFYSHFLVIGLLALFNFGLAGLILFGEHLPGWSTAGESIDSLLLVLFGRFEYNELHEVAPITAFCWFWGVYIFVCVFLLNILLAAVLHRYIDVQRRLGETGSSIATQFRELLHELRFGQSYEGSQKSIPYEKLLALMTKEGGMTSKEMKRAARFHLDRRLRTRHDLTKEEHDPQIDEHYLVDRGCDYSTAKHLVDRCTKWCNKIQMTTAPEHRLVVKVAKHMHDTGLQSEGLRERLRGRVNFAAACVDRIDLKHAKCYSVAKRVKRAQELPAGWEYRNDEEGRRYLRHVQTGLTSWTLPRNMIK